MREWPASEDVVLGGTSGRSLAKSSQSSRALLPWESQMLCMLEGTVIIQYTQFQDNELYDLVSTCRNTVCWDTINKRDTRSDERTTHTSVPR